MVDRGDLQETRRREDVGCKVGTEVVELDERARRNVCSESPPLLQVRRGVTAGAGRLGGGPGNLPCCRGVATNLTSGEGEEGEEGEEGGTAVRKLTCTRVLTEANGEGSTQPYGLRGTHTQGTHDVVCVASTAVGVSAPLCHSCRVSTKTQASHLEGRRAHIEVEIHTRRQDDDDRQNGHDHRHAHDAAWLFHDASP